MKAKYHKFMLLSILMVGLTCACSSQNEVRTEHMLTGRTMGTTYHIKIVSDQTADMTQVQSKVDDRLAQINRSMSTYQKNSEISLFNQYTQLNTPFKISRDFMAVMVQASQLYQMSEGAWDGTVKPLVNLWGFGSASPLQRMPAAQAIVDARRQVGFDAIAIDPKDSYLLKKRDNISLDLASIAKGFGVDQVARLLETLGFSDYLVEIGGEVFAAGHRPNGKPWRVGINRPQPEAKADAVYKIIEIENKAMATSGDYRNFQIIEGHAYSHIIDPRTGYPVQNGVVSTSVIADNCTLADGLATALMVMGPDKAMALLDRLPGVEGLVIVRKADNRFEDHASEGFGALTGGGKR